MKKYFVLAMEVNRSRFRNRRPVSPPVFVEKEFTSFNSEYCDDDSIGNYSEAAKAYIQSGGNVSDIIQIYEETYETTRGESGYDEPDYNRPNGRKLVWDAKGFDVYLNVYIVTQAYGGPEEGGWWYNCWEPEEGSCVKIRHRCVPTVDFKHDPGLRKKLEAHREIVTEAHGTHRPASSAAGDGYDLNIVLEAEEAEADNSYSPWC